MEQSELRIGNFYSQFGNITQVDWSTLKELEDGPIDQIWCKPIPLTEEWLLKFGLMSIKTELGLWNNGDAIYFNYGFEKSIQLKYVHQLQNLYFALTGEELKQEEAGKAFYESADKVIVVKRQEPLEEAADNWVRQPVIGTRRESFIAGANWMAERMYSEEEVIDLLQKMNDWPTICEGRSDIEEWFEQFKKK